MMIRLLTSILCLLFALPALAEIYDDTEIYFSNASIANANLLFILDNSSSMNDLMGQSAYNPQTTYPQQSSIAADGLYFSTSASDELGSALLIPLGNATNHCNSSLSDLSNQGYYSNSFMGLAVFNNDGLINNDEWRALTEISPTSREIFSADLTGVWAAVDCVVDYGSHGHNSISTSSRAYLDYSVSNLSIGGPIENAWRDDAGWDLFDIHQEDDYQQGFLYKGNYINWALGAGSETRMDVAVDVFKQIVNSPEVSALNIGLMAFQDNTLGGQGGEYGYLRDPGRYHWGSDGGRVIYPVEPLTSDSKQKLVDAADKLLDSMPSDVSTPLGETLYEAMLYLHGRKPYFGRGNIYNNTDAIIYFGEKSHPDSFIASYNNAPYDSPITEDCQKTHIIYLTDGTPFYDENFNRDHIQPELNRLRTKGAPYDCQFLNDNQFNSSPYRTIVRENPVTGERIPSLTEGVSCVDEIARFLHTEPLPRGKKHEGIFVNTIAFALQNTQALNLLEDTANDGGGSFFTANNASELLSAFESIVAGANSGAPPSAAPVIPPSVASRFASGNTSYMNLYKPSDTARWDGNLKSYFTTQTTVNGEPVLELVDVNDLPVIDTSTNLIDSNARSRWSDVVDGATVTVGGIRDDLALPRTLYVSDNTGIAQVLTQTLTTVSNEVLGVSSDEERQAVIGWALGQSTDPYISDPLHSTPVTIRYDIDGSAKDVVFFGTNLGMLHAVTDIDDGEAREEMAWMPQELLPNLKAYYENAPYLQKPYGLDGDIDVWHQDTNDDLIVNNGESVYMYIGMRRGGCNIYALDVSNIQSAPELLWKINGGGCEANSGTVTSGFDELGQTWSSLQRRQVRLKETANATQAQYKSVLIFSGGYDSAQDRPNIASGEYSFTDSTGRAVYMVDAVSGSLVWSASQGLVSSVDSSDITHFSSSIIASPSLSDTNGDGMVNLIVTVDAAGRVTRFDLDNSGTKTDEDFAQVTQIADLSPQPPLTTSNPNRRHFFAQPNVAITSHNGLRRLNIVLGSGRRPDLKSTVIDDRLYVLKQDAVYAAPTDTPSVVQASELAVVNVSGGSSDVSTSSISMPSDYEDSDTTYTIVRDKGFVVNLAEAGEKVLGQPTITGGTILAATYLPGSAPDQVNDCSSVPSTLGRSRLYAIRLAEPTFFQTFMIAQNGPPPDTVPIIVQGGKKYLGLPIEAVDTDGTKKAVLPPLANPGGSCGNASACVQTYNAATNFIRFWIERTSGEF